MQIFVFRCDEQSTRWKTWIVFKQKLYTICVVFAVWLAKKMYFFEGVAQEPQL